MELARKEDLLVMPTPIRRNCTIADIEALPEGQRAELIDGQMYMMASPSLNHQKLLMWLSVEIYNFIKTHNGKCEVLPAPFGVFIKKDDRNYFEPDISVICDPDKLDQKGCHGAPDWVIEIVSPSSRRMDYMRKLPVYQKAGVREYWIVDYDKQIISVHLLQEMDEAKVYHWGDKIKTTIYPDLEIDFSTPL